MKDTEILIQTSGRVYHGSPPMRNTFMSNWQRLRSDLAVNCPECRGTGRYDVSMADPDNPGATVIEIMRCKECKGKGELLTMDGENFMEFITTHEREFI